MRTEFFKVKIRKYVESFGGFKVHHQKMWLTYLNVIVVDWSVAKVTPRGLSVQDETLKQAARVKRLIGRPLESTLAERKSTTSYGEEPDLSTTGFF